MKAQKIWRAFGGLVIILALLAWPAYVSGSAGVPALTAIYVSSVSVPAAGNNGTTTTVTFNGTNLTGVTGASFYIGTVLDPSITIINIVPYSPSPDTKFKADVVVAAGATAGPRNVTVTTPSGTSSAFASGFIVYRATVSISAPASVSPGTNFWVSVNVTNVANLNSSQFDLSFNQTVMRMTGDENATGVTDGVTNGRIPGSLGADNYSMAGWTFQPFPGIPSGKIRVIGHMSGVSTVNGSGYLAKINFAVIGGTGTNSPFTFSNLSLYNANTSSIVPDSIGSVLVPVAGSASKLAFTTQPGSAPVGSAWSQQPVVAIEDSAGYVITNDNTTMVTLAISGNSSAALSGTKTVQASGGYATFSGLSINQTGNYTLTATSNPVLTPVTSDSFNILGKVNLALLPATQSVAVSSNFTLNLQAQCGDQTTDGIGVYLNFDPAYLNVLSVTPGTALSSNISNVFNNSTGSVNYGASQIGGPFPSGNFTVMSITLQALKATTSPTAISFNTTGPSATSVDFNGTDITGTMSGGSYTIADGEIIILNKDGGGALIDKSGAIFNISPNPYGTGNLTVADNDSNDAISTNGTIDLKNVPTGNYTVTQTFAPAGYVAAPGLQIANVISGPVTLGFTNNIAVGPASKLVFTTQPGGALAASALNPQPVVAIEDASGNVVTSDNTTTVTLMLSGNTSAMLSGTKIVQASGGYVAFSGLSVNQTGIYSLTATSSPGLIPAISGSINIMVGPASKLAFAIQPGGSSAGAPLNPQPSIAIQDSAGNLVTSDNVTMVTLSIGGTTTATLSGNTTVIAINGLAAFNGLSIDKTGTFTLTATSSPALTAPISTNFTVTPGLANKLVFTTQPGGAKAGANLNPQPVVAVQDNLGNLVTTDNTTGVTLVISGNNTSIMSGTKTIKAVNGLASYSGLSVNLAGSYSLTASTNTTLLPATSNAFNIIEGVNLVLLPSTQSVIVSGNFTLTVQAQCGTLTTDGIEIHLDFDPAYLNVQSATPGTALPTILASPNWSNSSGTFDFNAGKAGSTIPGGNFTLLTINFQAMSVTSSPTAVAFHATSPRKTVADLFGSDITGVLTGGSYNITNIPNGEIIILNRDANGNLINKAGAIFNISPNPYSTGNLTVADNDSNDATSTNGTIDLKNLPTGNYTVTQTAAPGGYALDPVPQTASVNLEAPVTLTFTDNQGQIKVLKKDQNGNLLGGSTFDVSRSVNGQAFAILITDNGNGDADPTPGVILFQKVPLGAYTVYELTAPDGYARALPQYGVVVNSSDVVTLTFVDYQKVDLQLSPSNQSTFVNLSFNVTIQALCGSQLVDGIDAYLDFDPAYLSVQSATAGTALSNILMVPVWDNVLGTFGFSANQTGGSLPSGNFTVVTLTFLAKQATLLPTAVTFHNSSSAGTRVDYQGNNITGIRTGASYNILADTPLYLSPASAGPVSGNQTFTMDINTNLSSSQNVSTTQAFINYDPAKLQVMQVTPGAGLTNILMNTFNNTSGLISYSANQTGAPYPSGNFTLATIQFRAQTVTSNTTTPVTISLSGNSTTSLVAFGGTNIPGTHSDASVQIIPGAAVNISVGLQGGSRPDASWIVPLNIKLFTPGTVDEINGTPLLAFTQNTTKSGSTAVTLVSQIMPGTYDITVGSNHTLTNLKKSVVISAPSSDVNFGTLLEGDANNSGNINIQDFGILAAAYGKASGTAGYDARADFDSSGNINIADFGLLAANYGKSGLINVP